MQERKGEGRGQVRKGEGRGQERKGRGGGRRGRMREGAYSAILQPHMCQLKHESE